MTGAAIRAIDPLQAAQQRAAGVNSQPRDFTNFQHWQVGFTFQMPLGMRAPLANTKQAQYALLRQRAFLQQIVHQTTHSLARFFLEVDANYKQFKTAARLRAAAAAAARGPEGVLRGGADHDRPLPRRRHPVRRRRRPGGPVQDHLQHLDRRAGGGQGDAARLRQHRGGRRARARARPTSRPATSRPRTSSSRSRTTARITRGRSTARPIPTRSSRCHPRIWAPKAPGRSSRPRSAPSARPRRRRRRRSPPESPTSSRGRRLGPPSRRWSPSRVRRSRLDPVRPRTCPHCRSRSTCPHCRRSDRDRTPE